MTSWSEAWAEIWEKSVSWVSASVENGWLSELAKALRQVPHGVWGRWKSQHRKMVSLSCLKTFKLKGNKKFRTWTKMSSSVFVFRDSYVIYIWVLNILCTFHISVSWVCNRKGILHSQKRLHYRNLPVRWFNVISRTLVGDGGGFTLKQRCSQYILQLLYSPNDTNNNNNNTNTGGANEFISF